MKHIILIFSFLIFSYTNLSAKTLEVSGEANLSFVSTKALISFDIIGRGATTEISYKDFATKSLNVLTYLKAESDEVLNLNSTSFVINPVYNIASKNSEIIGFDTISTVSFEVIVENVAIYNSIYSYNIQPGSNKKFNSRYT